MHTHIQRIYAHTYTHIYVYKHTHICIFFYYLIVVTTRIYRNIKVKKKH